MHYITIIGLVAASLTTVAFLPQVIRVWRLKEARDLSLTTFLLFACGVFLWFVYGLLNNDMPVILANAVTFVLAVIILYFRIKYA